MVSVVLNFILSTDEPSVWTVLPSARNLAVMCELSIQRATVLVSLNLQFILLRVHFFYICLSLNVMKWTIQSWNFYPGLNPRPLMRWVTGCPSSSLYERHGEIHLRNVCANPHIQVVGTRSVCDFSAPAALGERRLSVTRYRVVLSEL
jgi:hypothetical protein